MFYEISSHDPNTTTEVTYQLLEPVKMVVRNLNGMEVLTGFGLGENVTVIEPRVRNLVCTYEPKSSIKLADGREIISWERIVKTKMILT